MPTDPKITTELLLRGTLVVALMDAIYVPLLVRLVSKDSFRRLKWPLVIFAALVWFGIWSWAIGNFWETVYSYVFPPWAHTRVPWIAFFVAGLVALGLWMLALRIKANSVLGFLLMGGILGSLTHLWAVHLGIVTRPPMLQGASPLAAVVFAFFEYLFYWCVILTLAKTMDWMRIKFVNS
jgi:hypothetical protein